MPSSMLWWIHDWFWSIQRKRVNIKFISRLHHFIDIFLVVKGNKLIYHHFSSKTACYILCILQCIPSFRTSQRAFLFILTLQLISCFIMDRNSTTVGIVDMAISLSQITNTKHTISILFEHTSLMITDFTGQKVTSTSGVWFGKIFSNHRKCIAEEEANCQPQHNWKYNQIVYRQNLVACPVWKSDFIEIT